jgi:hypothetical protein
MVLVGIFIVHALSFHWVLPTLQSIWLSRAAASVVHRHAAQIGARNPVVAAAGYSEPSLVFLLGTGTILTDGPGAASHLAHAGRGGFALVRASDHEVFEAQLARFGLVPKHLATIQGFNYSTWARVRLDLYQAVE